MAPLSLRSEASPPQRHSAKPASAGAPSSGEPTLDQNTQHKHVRARAICERAMLLATTLGHSVPAYYPGSPNHMRTVDLPPLRIEIMPHRFRAYARKSKGMVGETSFERAGWMTIEIRLHNERRAVFNVCDDQLEIYHFQPGQWELRFGVDPAGDTTPILPDLFADDNDPTWQAFMASGLAKWPPELPKAPPAS